jgi:hypothetical protein
VDGDSVGGFCVVIIAFGGVAVVELPSAMAGAYSSAALRFFRMTSQVARRVVMQRASIQLANENNNKKTW